MRKSRKVAAAFGVALLGGLGLVAAQTMRSSGGMTVPSYLDGKELVQPEGYRKWVFVGASIGLSYSENNSNANPKELVDHNDTFMVGIGARIRIRPTVYLVGETAPRPRGDKQGVTHASFGIEERYGGHVFQLNVSNGFGTTLAQVARGGTPGDNWYLGFNLARKFY